MKENNAQPLENLLRAQNAAIAAESGGIGSCYIGDIMENYECRIF